MKKYFLHDGVAQQGPFDIEELKAKNITANTNVWFDPMPGWKPAGTIDELKYLFTPSAAPVDQDWNTTQFYYMDGGQQGPFFLYQLKGKNITANTSMWYNPLPKWVTAGEIVVLRDILTSGNASPAPAPAAAVENWSNKEFHYSDSSGQHGPFKLDQLKGKGITSNTPVWYDPLPKWTTAGQVAALKDVIGTAAIASTPAAPVAEDWNSKQFYYSDSAGQHGPFKLEQLKGMGITTSTPVWYDPLPKWTTAGQVAGLKDIISSAATIQHTATPSVENWNTKEFYFTENGTQQGPFKLEQLKGKNITANTPIWYDPLPKWTTAGQLAALKDIISSAATIQHTVTPAAENWSTKEFYFSENGTQQGPFNLEQLKGKNITANTPVWYDPLPNWTTAGEIGALKDIIKTRQSAPPSIVLPKQDDLNRDYFFIDAAGQQGPFKLEQLKGKNITAGTMVWYDPLPSWTTASEVPALKNILS